MAALEEGKGLSGLLAGQVDACPVGLVISQLAQILG